MGWRDATRDRKVCRVGPAVEVGEDRPERSGEHSERMREGASRTPTAFVLDDPTAGAAFCPSVLPTWILCGVRSAAEFVVDTTESVGLPGRSCTGGGFGGVNTDVVVLGCEGDCAATCPARSRAAAARLRDEPEPFIVTSRRRSSSNAGVLGEWSTLVVRLIRGVPSRANMSLERREERERSVVRDLRKTV